MFKKRKQRPAPAAPVTPQRSEPSPSTPLSFAAIDFETATEQPHSACALGIVVVDGDHTAEHSWLVKPPGNRYDKEFTAYHGLSKRDTRASNTFGEIWPEVKQAISGHTIIAHNMAFDLEVLKASYSHHFPDDEPPRLRHGCTLQMAHLCYPERTHYNLRVLCKDFGIPLQPHVPASDARAVVALVRLMTEQQRCDLKELIARSKKGAAGRANEARKRGMKASMAGKEPTEKQLNYLTSLLLEDGHSDKLVACVVAVYGMTDRAQVSECIDDALEGNEISVNFANKRQMKAATGWRNPFRSVGDDRGCTLIVQYGQLPPKQSRPT